MVFGIARDEDDWNARTAEAYTTRDLEPRDVRESDVQHKGIDVRLLAFETRDRLSAAGQPGTAVASLLKDAACDVRY